LNKGAFHSGAFIVAKISEPDYSKPSKVRSYSAIDAQIVLSDCDRNITLDFDSPTLENKKDFEKYLENSTHKITTLVSTLMEFNNELVLAYKRLESFKKPPKKKAEKKR